MSGALNLLRHFLCAIFCAREDQHRIGIRFFEQRQQQLRLQMRRHRIQRVRHGMRGAADAHRDLLRILERTRSKQFHFRWEGRREQHGLSLHGQSLDDALHVGQKTHVEHAVGFIQHKDFDFSQTCMTLIDEVQETTRADDEDFRAVAQCLDLGRGTNSPVDGCAPQPVPAARMRITSWICSASSRVGVTISARAGAFPAVSSLLRMGRTNAAVLPVPVCAVPMMSRPRRAAGIAAS